LCEDVCTVIGAPGRSVRGGAGAQVALDARSEALGLDDALEERGLDPGVGDAVADVPGEVVDHRVGRQVQGEAGAAVLVLVRDLVVGVEPGGHDDVDVRLLGDPLHPGDVATQTPHRRVDDGVDAQ
jgi:hypothetical protein